MPTKKLRKKSPALSLTKFNATILYQAMQQAEQEVVRIYKQVFYQLTGLESFVEATMNEVKFNSRIKPLVRINGRVFG